MAPAARRDRNLLGQLTSETPSEFDSKTAQFALWSGFSNGALPTLKALHQPDFILWPDRFVQRAGDNLTIHGDRNATVDNVLQPRMQGDQPLDHITHVFSRYFHDLLPAGKGAQSGPEMDFDDGTVLHWNILARGGGE